MKQCRPEVETGGYGERDKGMHVLGSVWKYN